MSPANVLVLIGVMKFPAMICGYDNAFWTTKQIIDALRRWDGIRISESTVKRVLRSVGYSWKVDRFTRDPDFLTTGLECGEGIRDYILTTPALDSQFIRAAIRKINETPPYSLPLHPLDPLDQR
jgi:hypothetical protein